MYQKLTLLCLFLFCLNIEAQDCAYSLTGQVFDIHDDIYLQGAVISIDNTNQVTYSDQNGFYKFDSVCEGNLTISVSHPYCETQTKTITVSKDTQLNFKLEHHLEELNEILLKGSLYDQELNSSLSNQLNKDQLEVFSNASLGDALKTISGVSSLNTGNAIVKPIINGLHSSRVLIITDDVRLHDQQWGEDHAPNVDINSAANITVIKGASALKYGGDAVGGSIIIEPQKAPIKDTLMGNVIMTGSSNGRGGSLSSNLMKANSNGFNYRIQGSLKRLGDLETPDYQLVNTGQQENNVNLGVGLNKIDHGIDFSYKFTHSEIGILRASHIGNVTDLANAINREVPIIDNDFSYSIASPKQEIRHHLIRLSAFKKIKHTGAMNLQYAFQSNNRSEFDVRRGGRSDVPAMDMDLVTHTFTTDLEWTAPKNFDSNFGVELNLQTNTPSSDSGVRRLIPDYDMLSAGVFATTDYSVSDLWIVDAGIRYDFNSIDAQKFYQISRWEDLGYSSLFPQFEVEESIGNQILTQPSFNYHNISASLGATHTFKNDWTLSSNFSSASRAPNPSELFSDGLHHSLARIEFGNLETTSEQSFKAGASLEGQIKALEFKIQPFYNYIQNFIILEPSTIESNTIRGSFPVWRYRQSDSRLFGIDVGLNYAYQNFVLNSNFAYVNGQDLDSNAPLINMPPFNSSNTLTYKIQNWNNFYLSLNSQFIAEQTRFPNTNFQTEIINRISGEPETILIDISTPPEAYHILNLKSGFEFNFNSKRLSINVMINNLLNTNYRSYLNALRFYADEVGTNAMLQLKFNY